jgi:hypothetical protein
MLFVLYSIGIIQTGSDESAPVMWSPRRGGANGETGYDAAGIAVGVFCLRRTGSDLNVHQWVMDPVTRVSSIAARFYTQYQ